MVYGLVSSQIRQSGQLVQIDLTFDDGLERTFLYDFSEKTLGLALSSMPS